MEEGVQTVFTMSNLFTPEDKARIDLLSVYQLLETVRYAPVGDERMSGEAGDYWLRRLTEVRAQNEEAYVAASKEIGWDR